MFRAWCLRAHMFRAWCFCTFVCLCRFARFIPPPVCPKYMSVVVPVIPVVVLVSHFKLEKTVSVTHNTLADYDDNHCLAFLAFYHLLAAYGLSLSTLYQIYPRFG